MTQFPQLTESTRVARLEPPARKIRVVIDTDTFNEIDDQFAIVYALLSPSRMNVEAIYAAPFHNVRSTGPGQGMELSYDEILRLLDLMRRKPDGFVFRGSTHFIGDSGKPQDNAAVRDLIDRAMASSPDDPLYIVALAAITNIASAILIEPRIIERIVVVWLGGHALWWPDTREFNLRQDPAAARVIFDCGVPVVMLPCMGVVSNLRTTVAELAAHVEPSGPLGAFLARRVKEYADEKQTLGWSKPIWDMAPVAWLNDARWTAHGLVPSPVLNSDVTWSANAARHVIRYIHHIDRDAIFGDFFAKLAAFSR
ncbi:nucleoside hydrolase [Pararobbsia silviterrae]|uniref:Nucleoside hydrolase n=1 Tax=Pararobbsia silviterrae TaxID=1792498 RepID=A0A494XZT0_9BURK|nr:nucleoside hydrolase [Pararobbsia silviterrae]RKP53706.1 nucleoside hydrolase [Pararobbsia silviterrae]